IRDLYSFGFMVRRPPCSTLFPYTTPSDLPVRRVDSIGGLPCAARRTRSLAGSREQADSIGQRPGTAGEANPSPGAPMRWVELIRSEEHTSELQSRENLVCRLLLEKKKIEP